jgi:hypothetical protein
MGRSDSICSGVSGRSPESLAFASSIPLIIAESESENLCEWSTDVENRGDVQHELRHRRRAIESIDDPKIARFFIAHMSDVDTAAMRFDEHDQADTVTEIGSDFLHRRLYPVGFRLKLEHRVWNEDRELALRLRSDGTPTRDERDVRCEERAVR